MALKLSDIEYEGICSLHGEEFKYHMHARKTGVTVIVIDNHPYDYEDLIERGYEFPKKIHDPYKNSGKYKGD